MELINGESSRKQPWYLRPKEHWASEQVVAQHMEALWMYGEPCLFTMMWRAQDHEEGLVELCSQCMGRSSVAFKQPERKKCPNCYGTTFEGGIKSQIIRPTLFNDRNSEMTDSIRGTVTIDTLMVETTPDFSFRKGDFIFRADGSRFQGEEKGEGIVRTGFGNPDPDDSFRGTIPSVRLEDPTSIAYTIPPSTADVRTLLSQPLGQIDIKASP